MLRTYSIDDLDPDDELEARWLRDHVGAPALELPHPEEQARDAVMREGYWMPVRYAASAFADELDFLKRRENDATPY